MKKPKSIVFDCDGVLIDSNRLKADAFRAALNGEPKDRIAAFFAYFHAHPGLSRFELFGHFYENIGVYPDPEEQTKQACGRFAELLCETLPACSDIQGIGPFLEMLEQERIACAIVSAALKSDLERVVFKRRWDGYFQAVCGAGRRKIEHIEELLATGTLTRDVMYFGDSRIDMEAAEATGCTFVFVSSASEWDDGERVCRSRGHGVIQDFRDALSWW